MRSSWLVLLMGSACAHSELPSPRFRNADPVHAVNDERDVPRPPKRRKDWSKLYDFDGSVRRPLTRPLELKAHRRALGVNALDEVPDSTWFTNRIGVRDLSPDDIENGPLTIESPATHLPWTVLGIKSEGVSLGLFVNDARGERFLIKFDAKGFPELQTAAHVIVDRLLWAYGYNVTEDFIAYVRRSDLQIAPNAVWTDAEGKTRRLDQADLTARLDTVDLGRDGRIRVLASRWLAGRALGGHPGEGVRDDDPNDRIPHQLRRDLRGELPIFAWLDSTDIKETNTLDMWIVDPSAPDRHFVRHYLLDFGNSLGAMAMLQHDPTRGYEYSLDYERMFTSLVSVGLQPRAWADRDAPPIVGVGLFEQTLDPAKWKPSTPAYQPLLETDRYDWLWGAKILIRFTPEQLRAAVLAGQLSDPRATAYLTRTLAIRQRAVAEYAFSRVRPFDNFKIDNTQSLCFDDLMITYGFVDRSGYTIAAYDFGGRKLGAYTARSTADGHFCTGALPLSRARDGYTIIGIRGDTPGNTYVHVARDRATSALRVIGIWRE